MVCQVPKYHPDDCYVCMVNMPGWNRQKDPSWHCRDIEFARWRVPHFSGDPIPAFTTLADMYQNDETMNISEAMHEASDNSYSNNNNIISYLSYF